MPWLTPIDDAKRLREYMGWLRLISKRPLVYHLHHKAIVPSFTPIPIFHLLLYTVYNEEEPTPWAGESATVDFFGDPFQCHGPSQAAESNYEGP